MYGGTRPEAEIAGPFIFAIGLGLATVNFLDFKVTKKLVQAPKKLIVYNSFSRGLLILYFAYSLWKRYQTEIFDNNHYQSELLVLAALAVYQGVSFGLIYLYMKNNPENYLQIRQYLGLLVTAAAVLLSLFVSIRLYPRIGALSIGNLSNLNESDKMRHDEQTIRDFQLLSQDIQSFFIIHNSPPINLGEVLTLGNSSSDPTIKGRIKNYTYTVIDRKTLKFKLCDTFFTSTSIDNLIHKQNVADFQHPAGYQCLEYSEFE
jgi:hypothetical protein